MGDLLRMSHINALPQPIIAEMLGGGEWEVFDVDVETGLMRINVCGLLEVKHIGDVKAFRDANGERHAQESLYSDYPEES